MDLKILFILDGVPVDVDEWLEFAEEMLTTTVVDPFELLLLFPLTTTWVLPLLCLNGEDDDDSVFAVGTSWFKSLLETALPLLYLLVADPLLWLWLLRLRVALREETIGLLTRVRVIGRRFGVQLMNSFDDELRWLEKDYKC